MTEEFQKLTLFELILNIKAKNLLLFSLTFCSISFAQFNEIGTDINKFFRTGKDVFIAPTKWQSNDLLIFSGTLAVTAGAFLTDEHVRDFSQRSISPFNDKFFQIDQGFNFTVPFIGIVGFYGYGLIFQDPKIRNLSLQLTEASAYAGIVTTVIKSVAGRSRPYLNRGNMEWSPFQVNDAQLSFPSGHSTLAFAFCTVMANHIDNTYWRVGWYSIAAFTGAARIYHDRHWLSDVVLGSAIGYFIGDYVTNHPENRSEQEGKSVQDYGFNFSIPLN